jgi:two-component SAPR family response regulator
VQDGIHLLLAQSQEPIEKSRPSLQVYAFGSPLLIVAGSRRRFTRRGGLSKAPEFLLYLLVEGQDGGCLRNDVSAAIWPDLEPERASTIFHQTLKRLRDVSFEAPDYIIRRDDYYQVNRAYLEWCDVLAFESLFERATRAAPETALSLQLELVALYRGEFLAGFELGEWGEAYRVSCETRFLQMVKLAGEQLLKAGLPQETLAAINKGLALNYFREDLHRTALNAYAQLDLYDHLAAHYAEMCATYKTEFGELPEPETQQLYHQLIAARQITLMTPA